MRIEYKDLEKKYDNKTVLKINKFPIEEGKIYSVLGFNGSGKSTLLKCTVGIEPLSKGVISYDGCYDINLVRDEISYMEQKPYIFNTTVENNIAKGLIFRGIEKNIIHEKLKKYISFFDMEHFSQRNALLLSGGESSKVALLRTAILETEVTLLDEPTSSMDVESTLKAEFLIKSIKDKKRSVIVVTHDIFQAERISDYIIFMDKGKIIEFGNKNKVLKNPSHPLVKNILNKI
ncbi:ATP-binding cassette domain-containing protein [Clostridium grantii]|uniref:Tungstate transport system ATP-binding protein n=1 Tax=Clostridium grantii DSM 8605 TaxID=1121316 RepID=A0A1M5W9H4_9CLOT|nr:ATP-binding cassette domain-containing protein [Clostridium grantii]SHH84229.1 tungstate transport system ATP-binding protein [Clostridium grantii DSM 8605]